MFKMSKLLTKLSVSKGTVTKASAVLNVSSPYNCSKLLRCVDVKDDLFFGITVSFSSVEVRL